MNSNTVTLTETEMAQVEAVQTNPRITEKLVGLGYAVRHSGAGRYAEFVLLNPRPFDPRVRTVSYLAGTFIGGCKHCKKPVRSEGAVDFHSSMNVHAACACGQWVKVERLRGRVTDHKCGGKCRASKGPVCECACGGANHGCG